MALADVAARFILVGGSQMKVDAMELYLQQRGATNTVKLVSAPDTNGNMTAVRDALAANDLARDPSTPLVILTNAYHLPRAAMFASDLLAGQPNVRFASAESIVDGAPRPLLETLESVPRLPRAPGQPVPAELLEMLERERAHGPSGGELFLAVQMRLDSEETGLHNWAAGEYYRQELV